MERYGVAAGQTVGLAPGFGRGRNAIAQNVVNRALGGCNLDINRVQC